MDEDVAGERRRRRSDDVDPLADVAVWVRGDEADLRRIRGVRDVHDVDAGPCPPVRDALGAEGVQVCVVAERGDVGDAAVDVRQLHLADERHVLAPGREVARPAGVRLGGRQRPVLQVPAGGGQRHDGAARSRQTQGDRQSRREHKESCSHGSPSLPAPLAGALVWSANLRRRQARVNEHDDLGACALGLRPQASTRPSRPASATSRCTRWPLRRLGD